MLCGKKENKPIIDRLEEKLNNILKSQPYAKEIGPMIEAFFKKAIGVVDNCERIDCNSIENITEIVKNVAKNTRDYYKLSYEDVTSLKKIFGEIDLLFSRALIKKSQSIKEEFDSQVTCINTIILKNMIGMHDVTEEEKENYRDGMLFQKYENLWKVIHRVNTDWRELCSRGFSSDVFNDYWDFFQNSRIQGIEMTEDKKFETFMAILDGTMKFVPVYEYKPVYFKPVANAFKGKIIEKIENRYSGSYRLRQNGEPVSQYVAAQKKGN